MDYVAPFISAKYLHFFLNELLLHEYAEDGVCSYFKAEQSEDKDMSGYYLLLILSSSVCRKASLDSFVVVSVASMLGGKKPVTTTSRITFLERLLVTRLKSHLPRKSDLKVFGIPSELAELEKTEIRYAWDKCRLSTNEEIWKIFPTSLHVDYLLCI
ncbi:vacuolar protein sorting-associated protein 53 A [Tanacetum coccineum]